MKISDILYNTQYKQLPLEERVKVWETLFDKQFSSDQNYLGLPDNEKKLAKSMYVEKIMGGDYSSQTPTNHASNKPYNPASDPIKESLETKPTYIENMTDQYGSVKPNLEHYDTSKPVDRKKWEAEQETARLNKARQAGRDYAKNAAMDPMKSVQNPYSPGYQTQNIITQAGREQLKQEEQKKRSEAKTASIERNMEDISTEYQDNDQKLLELSIRRDSWSEADRDKYSKLLQRQAQIEIDAPAVAMGMNNKQYKAFQVGREMIKENPWWSYADALGAGGVRLITSPYTLMSPGSELADINTYTDMGVASEGKLLGNLLRGTMASMPTNVAMFFAPAVAIPLTFTDITSSNIKQYYDEGTLDASAMWASAVSGVIQTGIEYAFDSKQLDLYRNAYKTGGANALKDTVRKTLQEATSGSMGKFVRTVGKGTATESLEEVYQNVADRVTKSIMNNEAIPSTPKELLEYGKELAIDALGGAMGGFIMGSVGTGVQLSLHKNTMDYIKFNAPRYESVRLLAETIELINAGDIEGAKQTFAAATKQAKIDQISATPLQRGFNLANDAINMGITEQALARKVENESLSSEIRDLTVQKNQLIQDGAVAGFESPINEQLYTVEQKIKMNEQKIKKNLRDIQNDAEMKQAAQMWDTAKQLKQVGMAEMATGFADTAADLRQGVMERNEEIDSGQSRSIEDDQVIADRIAGESKQIRQAMHDELNSLTDIEAPVTSEQVSTGGNDDSNSRDADWVSGEGQQGEATELTDPDPSTGQGSPTDSGQIQNRDGGQDQDRPVKKPSIEDRGKLYIIKRKNKAPIFAVVEREDDKNYYTTDGRAIRKKGKIAFLAPNYKYWADEKSKSAARSSGAKKAYNTKYGDKYIISETDLDKLPYLRAFRGRTFNKGDSPFEDVYIRTSGVKIEPLIKTTEKHVGEDWDTAYDSDDETIPGVLWARENSDSSQMLENAEKEYYSYFFDGILMSADEQTMMERERIENERYEAEQEYIAQQKLLNSTNDDIESMDEESRDFESETGLDYENVETFKEGDPEHEYDTDEYEAETDLEDGIQENLEAIEPILDNGVLIDPKTGRELFKTTDQDTQAKTDHLSNEMAEDALLGMIKSHIESVDHDADTMTVKLKNGRTLILNQKTGAYKITDKHGKQRTVAGKTTPASSEGNLSIVIDLVKGLNGGNRTLYHEAFHAVWRLFLTPAEVALLTRYYAKKVGNDIIDIEEAAANAAETYLGNRNDVPPGLRTLFRRFWDRIRHFLVSIGFATKKQKVEDIFRRMENDQLTGQGVQDEGAMLKQLGEPFNRNSIDLMNDILRGKKGFDFRYFKTMFSVTGYGDIDVPVGEDKIIIIDGKPEHVGFGLKHIAAKHPDVTAEMIRETITTGKPIHIKNVTNFHKVINGETVRVGVTNNWDGIKGHRVLTTAMIEGREAPTGINASAGQARGMHPVTGVTPQEPPNKNKISETGTKSREKYKTLDELTHGQAEAERQMEAVRKQYVISMGRPTISYAEKTYDLNSSLSIRELSAILNEKIGGVISSDIHIQNILHRMRDTLGKTELFSEAVRNAVESLSEEQIAEYFNQSQKTKDMWERDLSNLGIVQEALIIDFADGDFTFGNIPPKYSDQWLKAPNGKPTKLNERQWLQVRTPNFINWFGDWINDPKNASKVVDENGEPMVVYHGTGKSFAQFNKSNIGKNFRDKDGFFFTNNTAYMMFKGEVAEDDTSAGMYAKNAKGQANIMPVFVSLRSPKTIRRNSDGGSVLDFFEEKNKAFTMDTGFDGLIAQDTGTDINGNPETVIVATSSTQIKSATANTGEFSAENPDIRYKLVPEAVNRKFNEDLRLFNNNKLPQRHVFALGNPGEILKQAGFPDAPVEMLIGTLKDKVKSHRIEPSDLNDLPEAINDPIFTARSKTKKNSLVIFTEIEHQDGNIMVAVEVDKTRSGIKINDIRSIYGKNSENIIAWFRDDQDQFTYINKEKSLSWLNRSAGSQSRKLVQTTKAIDKINESVGLSSPKFETVRNMLQSGDNSTRFKLTDLYHGSGAFFDRFDLKFIGTGEGAQAFGWGIYVTEREGVARYYAQKAAKQHRIAAVYKGEPAINSLAFVRRLVLDAGITGDTSNELDYPLTRIINYVNRQNEISTMTSAIEAVDMAYKDDRLDKPWLTAKTILKDAINDNRLQLIQYAKNLYTVSVWDNHTEDVLDWNEEVTDEQIDKILEQADKENIEFGEDFEDARTGKQVYDYLKRHYYYGDSVVASRKASEFFLRAGIDGIKYPVQALSGGKGEKGYNYVVFDANQISITQHERYRLLDEDPEERLIAAKKLLKEHNKKYSKISKEAAEKIAEKIVEETGIEPIAGKGKIARMVRAAYREGEEKARSSMAILKIANIEQKIKTNKPDTTDQSDMTFHLEEAERFAQDMGISQDELDSLGADGYTFYAQVLNLFAYGNTLYDQLIEKRSQAAQNQANGIIDQNLNEEIAILTSATADAWMRYDNIKTNAGRILRHAREEKKARIGKLVQLTMSLNEERDRQYAEIADLQAELAEAETMLAELEKSFDILMDEIQRITGSRFKSEYVETLRQQKAQMEERITSVRNRIESLQHRINKATDALKLTETQITKIDQQIAKTEIKLTPQEMQTLQGIAKGKITEEEKGVIDDILKAWRPLVTAERNILKHLHDTNVMLTPLERTVLKKLWERKHTITDFPPIKPSIWDIARSIFYQNILSSPMTHAKNLVGNEGNMILENAVNMIMGLEFKSTLKSITEAKAGIKAMKAAFMDGTEFMKKYDTSITNAKLLRKFTLITRALAAEDAFFYRRGYGAQLMSLAIAESRKNGISVQELIDNPTVAMIKQAEYEASRATFNYDPEGILGSIVSGIEAAFGIMDQLGTPGRAAALILKMKVMPFTRVVANVFNAGLDWTPLGFLGAYKYGGWVDKAGQRKIWTDANGNAITSPYKRRDITRQLIRATLGTIGMALAYALLDGLLSGSGPDDPEERRQLQETGWRPYAIKIGDRWYPYTMLPISPGLAVIANYSEARQRPNRKATPEEALSFATMGIMNTMLDKSFLSGLSGVIEAVARNDKKYMMRSVAETPAQLLPVSPNFSRFLNDLFYTRQHNPETTAQYMMYSLRPITTPWLREAIPARINVIGEESNRFPIWQEITGSPMRDREPLYVFNANNIPVDIRNTINAIVGSGLKIPSTTAYELKIDNDQFVTMRGWDKEAFLRARGMEVSMYLVDYAADIQSLAQAGEIDELHRLLQNIATKSTKAAKKQMLEKYDEGQLKHKYTPYSKSKEQEQ